MLYVCVAPEHTLFKPLVELVITGDGVTPTLTLNCADCTVQPAAFVSVARTKPVAFDVFHCIVTVLLVPPCATIPFDDTVHAYVLPWLFAALYCMLVPVHAVAAPLTTGDGTAFTVTCDDTVFVQLLRLSVTLTVDCPACVNCTCTVDAVDDPTTVPPLTLHEYVLPATVAVLKVCVLPAHSADTPLICGDGVWVTVTASACETVIQLFAPVSVTCTDADVVAPLHVTLIVLAP